MTEQILKKLSHLILKKKIRYWDVWWTEKLVLLWDIAEIKKWKSITSRNLKDWKIPVVAWWKQPAYFHNESNRDWNVITVSASWANAWFVNYFDGPIFASDCNTILSKDEEKISTKLLFEFLKSIQSIVYWLQTWQAQPHVYWDDLYLIKIPLPPKDIQQKIVDEIWELEKIEEKNLERIWELEKKADWIIGSVKWLSEKLWNIVDIKGGKRLPKWESFSAKITDFPFLRVIDFVNNSINMKNLKYVSSSISAWMNSYKIYPKDIYISVAWTIGKVWIIPKKMWWAHFTENAAKFELKDWIYSYIFSIYLKENLFNNSLKMQ